MAAFIWSQHVIAEDEVIVDWWATGETYGPDAGVLLVARRAAIARSPFSPGMEARKAGFPANSLCGLGKN
jgi:hypothetical protein